MGFEKDQPSCRNKCQPMKKTRYDRRKEEGSGGDDVTTASGTKGSDIKTAVINKKGQKGVVGQARKGKEKSH